VLSFRAAAGPARGARPAEAGVRPRSRREAISAVREEGTDDAEATAGEELDRELSETKRQLADVRERLAERELDALGAAAEPEPEPEPDDEVALVRASVTPVEDRPALSDEEVSDLRARLAHAAAMKKQGTSS